MVLVLWKELERESQWGGGAAALCDGEDQRVSARRTPLHAAAFAEDVAGLQLVLRHGAQVNGVDESGRSALMVAADKGQSGTVGRSDGAVRL